MAKKLFVFMFLSSILFIFSGGCDDDAARWTRQFTDEGESHYIEAGGIATDLAGNSYIAGLTLGQMGDQFLNGYSAAYLVKYSRSGERLWTRLLDGLDSETSAAAVAVDGAGNAVIAGMTTADLGGQGLAGNIDMYVARYGPGGEKQWTAQIGCEGVYTYSHSAIAADIAGNIYVTGVTHGDWEGDAISYSEFVLKLDPAGQRVWSVVVGTADSGFSPRGIATDAAGNSYVTGLRFDSSEMAQAYLMKINADGVSQWNVRIGSDAAETYCNSVAVDPAGNCYLTGVAYGELNGQTVSGYSDIFTAKYSSSGVMKWTRLLGAADVDAGGVDIAVDLRGNVYATGGASGSIDGQEFNGLMGTVLVKYNRAGVKKWTKMLTAGGETVTDPAGISLDGTGTHYLMGRTDGALDNSWSPDEQIVSIYITTELND